MRRPSEGRFVSNVSTLAVVTSLNINVLVTERQFLESGEAATTPVLRRRTDVSNPCSGQSRRWQDQLRSFVGTWIGVDES